MERVTPVRTAADPIDGPLLDGPSKYTGNRNKYELYLFEWGHVPFSCLIF